mmetsp:Transcript_38910/g.115345  ORF Transcript_38910/g.115345 Transcript_38910/m.115345 type:complete len:231 (+) Transcript_38910:1008-1700(+)
MPSIISLTSRRRESMAKPTSRSTAAVAPDIETSSTMATCCRKDPSISASSWRVTSMSASLGRASATRFRSSDFRRSMTSTSSLRVTRSRFLGAPSAETLASSCLTSACLTFTSSSSVFRHFRKRCSAASARRTCMSMASCRPLTPPPRAASCPSSRGCLPSRAATLASKGCIMMSIKRSLCSCCRSRCRESLPSMASSSLRTAGFATPSCSAPLSALISARAAMTVWAGG